jgi:hypothetical protein
MAGAFQSNAFQNNAFQTGVAVKTGGGIAILRRIIDEPIIRILEPVATAAVAMFWSIATIDWVLAAEGELAGRGWTHGELAWTHGSDSRRIRARGYTRGLSDHRVVLHETEAEEEVLIGI